MTEARRIFTPTHMRAWREYRKLTLDEAAHRLLAEYGVETTKTSLSRIELGKQPYSQPLTEALAKLYGAGSVGALLEQHPLHHADIVSFWGRIAPSKRDDAKRILEALATPADRD